jgi:hypothetical protein
VQQAKPGRYLRLITETAFGLSIDEADLARPLLKVPDQPADFDLPVLGTGR